MTLLKKSLFLFSILLILGVSSCGKSHSEDVKKKNDNTEIKADDNGSDDNNDDDNNGEGGNGGDDNNGEGDNSGDDNNGEDDNNNLPQPTKSTFIAFDFTAQYCIYCPNMTRQLLTNKKKYPNNFILVALHSRKKDSPHIYQEEAKKYHKYLLDVKTFGQDGFPAFTYNSLGTHKDDRGLKEMVDTPSALQLNSDFKCNNNEIDITFKGVLCAEQENRIKDKKFTTLMWITESDVIAMQADNTAKGGWNMKYKHEYLFRGSLNGLWGVDYKIGDTYKLKTQLPNTNIKVENAYLVVMVLNKETKEVIAAKEYPLRK